MVLIKEKFLDRHLLILEYSQVRKTIILEESKYCLGRQSSSDIVIKLPQISQKHATLVKKTTSQTNQYSYWILDGDLEGNKSRNGIYINGKKCLIHELKNGDLINFGCEVNASYHILSNKEVISNNSNYLNTFPNKSQEKSEKTTSPTCPQQVPDPGQELVSDLNTNREVRSKLMISEPHLTISYEDTLPDQIYLDPITELPNQNLFQEYLSIAIGNAAQNQKSLAILYFDIEQFRDINEQWGIAIGDKVLQEFGKQLKACLRLVDIVARWESDEFVVLLPQINTVEDLPKISERILNHLQQPFQIDSKKIEVKSTVGFAIYPDDGSNKESLLKQTQTHLEQRKKNNKNSMNLDRATINYQNNKNSKIEALLKQAIHNREFLLYYQPQVNIKTGRIDGIEALLRWYHIPFGAISPSQFIPWLQKTDLIISLTQWILETVCEQHKAWGNLGFTNLPVSINLSSEQLHHPNLLKMVTEILLNSGLDPSLMILEITETAFLTNAENTFRLLWELKQLGIQAAIDDFGSGYTAVSHLQQFPFSQVKIAQSLIQLLRKHTEEISMIAAIIALGKVFNLKVVAEGVETQKQLDILRQLNCDIIQGYVFTPALNEKDLIKFLSLHL